MFHFKHTLAACSAIVFVCGAAAITSVAYAQTTAAAFAGTWTVTWQGARTPQQARLVITESGGTYKASTRPREDPCIGREAPITLQDIDGQEATVLLKFSEALQGCADGKLRIKKIDDKTMTGMRGQAVLTITRD